MQIAHELGKDLNEVRTWSLNDVKQWLAYFSLKDKYDAADRKRKSRQGGNAGKGRGQ